MSDTAQLERAVLSLVPTERAELALLAWESLETDPAFAADRNFDPAGIAIATERDLAIESGSVQTLTHEEFRRRTSGVGK
jgi:hypothetical protein